jgi:hypothetical protein
VIGIALTAGAVAVVLIFLGLVAPVDAARIYLLGLVGVAGAVAASGTLSHFGRLERRRRRVKGRPVTPAFFERTQRRIELASASGIYFEQLRPRLREIAEQRLAKHGLRLKSDGARQLLGEEAWQALERPPAGDRFERPERGRLARVIGALERL